MTAVPGLATETRTFEQLVQRARTLAVPGQRHILGLTGAPGAGKSTVAEQLVDELGPELAVLVPMDGFHLANRVLADLGRRERKGAHDTFDDDGYANLLERIHSQTSDAVIYAPEFRRDLEEPIGSSIAVAADVPLIVTEGNYLLLDHGAWPRARRCVDEVWFLAPGEDVRHDRLIRRHESYGKSPDEARTWALGSDEQNALLIAATAHNADAVIELI
ncbi:nucleoside/nucleotide kinase family protein [Saxibacter everestensis]|uniref:Nucleoside/nucleotide kinase family protein n=1 Tax=Saxibacter everestensis TaxID=2909229 RepID=A0ABY8QT36_9MICO|nr:nucleoside/nucleotide kinase family protein [Brevibacteriaceae bacterium ZFBP1038]